VRGGFGCLDRQSRGLGTVPVDIPMMVKCTALPVCLDMPHDIHDITT
jgi:hypothetical protein